MSIDYSEGQTVLYRPVFQVPCEPVPAVVVEESTERPGRVVIDCGPSGYPAPHNRRLVIAWPEQLRKV